MNAIAQLNDRFCKGDMTLGQYNMTQGVQGLEPEKRLESKIMESIPKYALYRDELFSVEIPTPEEVRIAIEDAERMLGLREVKNRTHCNEAFLKPPEKGTWDWEYATHLVNMKPPIVWIASGGYKKLVSLDELSEFRDA